MIIIMLAQVLLGLNDIVLSGNGKMFFDSPKEMNIFIEMVRVTYNVST